MQKIYAHRGASGYAPENTLRAFALAADMGADGVELDVQISKDGRLVVFHDDELSRLTGFTGSVADYTYAELCRMPVIHAVDATERDVAPLLEDVLALLHERGLSVNIELKNSRAAFPARPCQGALLLSPGRALSVPAGRGGVLPSARAPHPRGKPNLSGLRLCP